MPKYTYSIECPIGYKEGWNAFKKDQTQSYCQGYMDAMRGQYPGQALRMVRSDGRVMEEIDAHDDVAIGMVAGFPTPEQYESAAERALERARKIRENQERSGRRRPGM